MSETFTPFRGIQTVRDLLLIDEPTQNDATLQLEDSPYYPELCLWVTVRAGELDLFRNEGQTLVDATTSDGHGWRLGLTQYGYFVFESQHSDPAQRQSVQSHLPIHAVVGTEQPFQLGVALSSPSWIQRGTPYAFAQVNDAKARLRLFAISGPGQPISEIGGDDLAVGQAMNPVPETFTLGRNADGSGAFAGRIERLTAYNTARLELFDLPFPNRSAYDALPLIEMGSSFEPRWVDDQTIEVFTRPHFSGSDAFWIYLDLSALPEACRRLRLWTRWQGGTNMSPTFFWSRDGDTWQRVVPARASMRMGDGRNYQAEFEVAGPLREGGYLASAPSFTAKHQHALLDWARRQPDVTVTQIGESVEGRPIHAIRMARGEDGPERHGVAVTSGQHSPLEIMDGHLIRPMMERIAAHPTLLDQCNFYFVPTINVDGQHYGGNGLNANQRNTNRHWLNDLQPETQACVDYFDALKQAGQRFDLAIDLHAGGTFKNHLLFAMGDGEQVKIDEQSAREQDQWWDLLEAHAGVRRVDSRTTKQQDIRAADYFYQVHGAVAWTLELSTCSCYDPQLGQSRPFDADVFDKLADGLARTFAAKLCAQDA